MAIDVRGKVILGGVTLTTDPKITRTWKPRRSVLQGIGGKVTHQDFGRWAKDMTLDLDSEDNYLNAAQKAAIDALVAVRGVAYSYSDYQGIVGDVVILDFVPEPTFIGDGDNVLYKYKLTLQMMTLTKLDFAAYTGS